MLLTVYKTSKPAHVLFNVKQNLIHENVIECGEQVEVKAVHIMKLCQIIFKTELHLIESFR